MSFPGYPEYKDSRVPWLGEVPASWSVERFRHVFRESGEKIENEVVGPMLSVSGYRGIEVKEYDDENRRRLDEELIGYRIVRPGQLVVNTMWLNYAGLGVSDHEGHVSPAYRSYWIEREVDRRYIHHLMRSSIYVQGYTRLLTGIRPNSLQMSRDDLMDFPVIIPPPSDQAAIAAFLDRETAKIDALVAEQERLIALLKEKRQAVISHAVTKGLNPHAPMKDSGIEWLGEIPAHWEICRLKHVVQKTDGLQMGPFGGMLTSLAAEQTGFKLYGQENTISGDFERGARWITSSQYEEMARYALLPGDMVLTRKGSLGACRLVPPDIQPGIADSDTVRIRLDHGFIEADFAVSLMKDAAYVATQVDLTKRGAILAGLNTSVIANLVFALPPLGEQFQISSYLESLREQFGELISESQAAITLLQERRAALISAAVTGKIDVRGLVDASSELEAA